MEKISFETSSDELVTKTNANNNSVEGTTDIKYGMTSEEFLGAINDNRAIWANEAIYEVTAQSSPETFMNAYNEAVDGGLELSLTFDVTPEDATILVKEGETTINAVTGVYPITKGHTYEISVSKTGYKTYTETFTCTGNVQAVIDLVSE